MPVMLTSCLRIRVTSYFKKRFSVKDFVEDDFAHGNDIVQFVNPHSQSIISECPKVRRGDFLQLLKRLSQARIGKERDHSPFLPSFSFQGIEGRYCHPNSVNADRQGAHAGSVPLIVPANGPGFQTLCFHRACACLLTRHPFSPRPAAARDGLL
jgi:hypothetical protein